MEFLINMGVAWQFNLSHISGEKKIPTHFNEYIYCECKWMDGFESPQTNCIISLILSVFKEIRAAAIGQLKETYQMFS